MKYQYHNGSIKTHLPPVAQDKIVQGAVCPLCRLNLTLRHISQYSRNFNYI
jgi:hypothetical protein